VIWLAFALQAAAVPLPAASDRPAPVATRPDGSQSWSIMSCPTRAQAGEIVVCGSRDQNAFEGPAAGRGANRDMSGAQALALQSTPCAARVGGCQVGVNILGPPTMLVRAVQKLVNPNGDCCEGDDATNPLSLLRDATKGVKGAFAGKVDRSKRVPILLDDPAIGAETPPSGAVGSRQP